jgi:hypothetical protein
MKRDRALRQRMFSLALAIALNLASAYAFACPIACSAQPCCTGREGACTMPGMPRSHPCCPDQSDGTTRMPCSGPAHPCVSHSQYMAYLVPAVISAPRAEFLPAAAPICGLSRLSFGIRLVTYSCLSPPGYSPSGRAICQRESFLRI